MRNLKQISTPEMERALISEAEDNDAWEAPIKVESSKSPRPAWYQKKGIPIGIALADCGNEVDTQQVYRFITGNVTGVTAYVLRPKGLQAAALDLYLVLGAIASVTSIANVLWMAYDRFITPKNRRDNSAGIYIAVRIPDREPIHLLLGRDVTTKEEFIERFDDVISRAQDPKLRAAHDATLQELRESDSWMEVTS